MTQPIWVLGNGQLGNMLKRAADQLGVKVNPLGLEDSPPELAADACITVEREHWPETELTRTLEAHPGFRNYAGVIELSHRADQKSLLDRLQLATAPWHRVTSRDEWQQLHQQLGEKLVVKTCKGGYDGKGQWRITADNIDDIPAEAYGDIIAEQMIPFCEEVSLIGARNKAGEKVFLPLTTNYHQDGILRASIARPESCPQLQAQAEAMLGKLMDHLDYAGVITMECFRVEDKLLINEIAPRVHNSGHWSMDAGSVSQFELHIRAMMDWPLLAPEVQAPAVMVNLIGIDFNPQWLASQGVSTHWYGKEVRPGRKVGHLNLSHFDTAVLTERLKDLATKLEEDDQPGINWLIEKLAELSD